jgi:hypothetical protein
VATFARPGVDMKIKFATVAAIIKSVAPTVRYKARAAVQGIPKANARKIRIRFVFICMFIVIFLPN